MNPKKEVIIFCDGGARGNPGPAAFGVVVKDAFGKTLETIGRTIGETTNNVAEYHGAIAALSWIKEREEKSPNEATIYTLNLDSRLVMNQLIGKFKVKNEELKRLIVIVRELEREANLSLEKDAGLFTPTRSVINYTLIPREQNWEADALVNAALDRELR